MPGYLVTGANGQLGRAVMRRAAERGVAAVGMDLPELDITDAAAVRRVVRELRPEVVVNCAAYTDVDGAESEPERAFEVNGAAVGHLAEACRQTGALLVQVSTDYVFGGDLARPYREEDPPAPLGVYGRSKLEGERQAARCPRHLIVRTAWLYGTGGRNFVEAIRGQVVAGASELRVVADQRGNPTSAADLADAILDLVARGARGVVHAVNEGVTSWHGFAQAIVAELGANVPVHPIASADLDRPAPRPANSALDTSRLEAWIGRRMPPWRDALRRYLESAR